MDSEGVDPKAEQRGSMALTTTAKAGISYRTAWLKRTWWTSLLDFWDDFSDDGELEERDVGSEDAPIASLAVKLKVPPRCTKAITFLLTWHLPNRYTWTSQKMEGNCSGADGPCDTDQIGNYYAAQYRDAWDVADKVAPQLPKLEETTVRFVRAFCDSELPEVVKEAALFNLANLRTQTCFRTPDGRFYGWEGCCDHKGCCHGSCTHVWNYEQAVAFLLGNLAKTMREVEFAHTTRDDGLMSFRVNLPLERAQEWGRAAADGQMGCIMKMYRDWQLSGDDAMLKNLWPKVKKALEFCWIEGGWDGDRDGVMEGCQHNTMDVEYYGPNPQMGTWYLGALRAAEEMACYLGEKEFAETCRDLFERGKQWIDANLFNGEYYDHQIRAPRNPSDIAEGLGAVIDTKNLTDPDYQLGAGCLVDQLVGQFLAHVCDLGHLLNPANVRQSLRSIMKYNFRTDFHNHFNCNRSFVLGDESALLMASYPKDRPKIPFPYFSEVMTGFEYVVAIGMIYEGQVKNGLKCIQNIRNRYDGYKRSPFNEAEAGHHYARAMASWAAVLALTGFHYSGVDKSMTFTAQDGTFFWSNGYAWGTCNLRTMKKGVRVELSVLHGELALSRFILRGFGHHQFNKLTRIKAGKGKKASFHVRRIADATLCEGLSTPGTD